MRIQWTYKNFKKILDKLDLLENGQENLVGKVDVINQKVDKNYTSINELKIQLERVENSMYSIEDGNRKQHFYTQQLINQAFDRISRLEETVSPISGKLNHNGK